MKRLLSFIMLFFLLFQLNALAFSDMESHWAKSFVDKLAENSIVDGYIEGGYRPESSINTDEFIKLVLTAIGENVSPSNSYWAENYIKRAYELNIVWYTEFDTFSRPILRGEMARIMVRALKLSEKSGAEKKVLIQQISDYYDILNQYKDYVLTAYANGLINGYNDGSFLPMRTATRAEAAVMITRMLKIKPLDISSSSQGIAGNYEYFVAPNGDDANDGSLEKPFKTIEKARDTIREIKERPDGGITVYLRQGDYEIDKTISFDASDGGSAKSPVTYTAYKNERVRLRGSKGLEYNGFKKISDDMAAKLISGAARTKVLEIDLKSQDITDYGEIVRRGFLINDTGSTQMELFIDGERMQLGRWPNNGYTGIGETVRTSKRSKSDITNGAVYKYVDAQPTKWKTDISNIFVSGVLGPNYAYDYYPIESINSKSGEITLREGAIQNYYSKPFVYYENIFEEIDTPGEYYVDREKGILYLYPPEGFSKNSDIRVSQLTDTMITLNGTSYISFKKLQMDTARGQVFRSTEPTDSILIENCTIRNTGSIGITINNTKNTKIRNNHIYDLGYTGISLSGGDYANLISGNNIIENNHIHKIAQIERSYQTGVTLGYRSVGTILRNNEIHDTPHTAVIIYGPEHIIEYNNIYDAVKEFHDMDAIYMNVYVYPWERGVTIRNNYIHDLGKQMFTERQMNVAGIRTDNNGSGLNVIGNIFYNIGYKDSNQIRGVCAEGSYNRIENNIFIDVAEAYDGPSPYNSGAKFDLEGNQTWKTAYEDYQKFVGVYAQKYPEILDFWKVHFMAAQKTNIYAKNLVVNIAIPISTLNTGYDLSGYRADPQLVLAENNYAVTKDPGFVDYKNKNFSLKSDAEVYSKIPGFEPIDFSKIGIPAAETVGCE